MNAATAKLKVNISKNGKRMGRPPKGGWPVLEEPKNEKLAVSEPVKVLNLPGTWEEKQVDSAHHMYASFDACLSFYTKKGAKTGKSIMITLEDGSRLQLDDVLEAKAESVRIIWPTRSINPNWQKFGKNGWQQAAEKQKENGKI